jgi:hypothetical protein
MSPNRDFCHKLYQNTPTLFQNRPNFTIWQPWLASLLVADICSLELNGYFVMPTAFLNQKVFLGDCWSIYFFLVSFCLKTSSCAQNKQTMEKSKLYIAISAYCYLTDKLMFTK